jgi:hypothetical protein
VLEFSRITSVWLKSAELMFRSSSGLPKPTGTGFNAIPTSLANLALQQTGLSRRLRRRSGARS